MLQQDPIRRQSRCRGVGRICQSECAPVIAHTRYFPRNGMIHILVYTSFVVVVQLRIHRGRRESRTERRVLVKMGGLRFSKNAHPAFPTGYEVYTLQLRALIIGTAFT